VIRSDALLERGVFEPAQARGSYFLGPLFSAHPDLAFSGMPRLCRPESIAFFDRLPACSERLARKIRRGCQSAARLLSDLRASIHVQTQANESITLRLDLLRRGQSKSQTRRRVQQSRPSHNKGTRHHGLAARDLSCRTVRQRVPGRISHDDIAALIHCDAIAVPGAVCDPGHLALWRRSRAYSYDEELAGC
jgi:hypothetical protein